MTLQLTPQAIPFSLPARPRPDGSYIASVKTPEGKWRDVRIPKSVAAAPNYKGAERWILQHLPELAAGASPRELVAAPTPTPAARATFSALGPAILEARDKDVIARKRSEATRYEFGNHWKKHVEPFFGGMAPHEVEPKHLNAFIEHLAKGHAARTVRNIFKDVGIAFKIVLGRGLDPKLTRHPVRQAFEAGLLALPSIEDAPIAYIPRADASKLLKCAAAPLMRRARYALALLSGMREGDRGPHLGRRRLRGEDSRRQQGPARLADEGQGARHLQAQDQVEQAPAAAPPHRGGLPGALEGERLREVRGLESASDGPGVSERARTAEPARRGRAHPCRSLRRGLPDTDEGHRCGLSRDAGQLRDMARRARSSPRCRRSAHGARRPERPPEALHGRGSRSPPPRCRSHRPAGVRARQRAPAFRRSFRQRLRNVGKSVGKGLFGPKRT